MLQGDGFRFNHQRTHRLYCHEMLLFIDPGHPAQDASVESFNGKFREECLNETGSGASNTHEN